MKLQTFGVIEFYGRIGDRNYFRSALDEFQEYKKLKDNHKQAFSALESLRFNDVMAISSAPKDLAFEQTYICRLKDSTVYTLEIAKNDDKNLIKCRAEFTDTEQVIKENKVESQENLKKKEAKLLARDAAEQFNKNHSNWIYEIDDWKAKNLTKAHRHSKPDAIQLPHPNHTQVRRKFQFTI